MKFWVSDCRFLQTMIALKLKSSKISSVEHLRGLSSLLSHSIICFFGSSKWKSTIFYKIDVNLDLEASSFLKLTTSLELESSATCICFYCYSYNKRSLNMLQTSKRRHYGCLHRIRNIEVVTPHKIQKVIYISWNRSTFDC